MDYIRKRDCMHGQAKGKTTKALALGLRHTNKKVFVIIFYKQKRSYAYNMPHLLKLVLCHTDY